MSEEQIRGIILLFPYSFLEGIKGAVLGITSRELANCPRDIKINIAQPIIKGMPPDEMSQVNLYWLENCPAGDAHQWSERACSYYLLQEFSRLPGTGQTAIRVKPSEARDPIHFDHDFIFWRSGKAVPLGQQYPIGDSIVRRTLGNTYSLHDVVEAWKQEAYEQQFSREIGEFEGKIEDILFKGEVPPSLVISEAERDLEIRARNAGWPSTRPLVEATV